MELWRLSLNNSTKINKTNNHLSPQIIEHNKNHDFGRALIWEDNYWVIKAYL